MAKDLPKSAPLTIEVKPKANCKKCYGRGYLGVVRRTDGSFIKDWCACVRKQVQADERVVEQPKQWVEIELI